MREMKSVPDNEYSLERERGEYSWRNRAITQTINPDFIFKFAAELCNVSERWTNIRECYAGIMNDQHQEAEFPAHDILFQADFVEHRYPGSDVCLCNSSNMKKKRFRYVFEDREFHFASLLSLLMVHLPSSFLFDFALMWR
jgi:hypothetical protein